MKCGKPYCACVGQCFAESSPLDDGQLMTTNTTQQALNAALAECERLRAALEEFVSIVGTEAGFETAMTESDDAFTEFLNKQQARVDSAVANASALLDAARGKP